MQAFRCPTRPGGGFSLYRATCSTRRLGRTQPDIADHKPTVGNGRYSRQVDAQILRGNVVIHLLSQQPQGRFHQYDGYPLSGTTMMLKMISAALGDKVKGAAAPVPKSLWPEPIRLLPGLRISTGPI